MVKVTHLKADLKQITGEPMMLMFAFLSLLLIGVFKGILVFAPPIVEQHVGIDILDYQTYILAMVYMLHPLMIGMVIGFFMLDEKDAKIFELLRVTPLGFSGYLINRLMMPAILVVFYAVISYLVIGTDVHEPWLLLPIIVFMLLEMITVGMFVPMVSEDKVKGLTNTKATSGLMIFAFFDLLPIPELQFIAKFVPFYYMAKIINETEVLWMGLGLVVHLCWLTLVYRLSVKRL